MKPGVRLTPERRAIRAGIEAAGFAETLSEKLYRARVKLGDVSTRRQCSQTTLSLELSGKNPLQEATVEAALAVLREQVDEATKVLAELDAEWSGITNGKGAQ